jgi:hypothetical protein
MALAISDNPCNPRPVMIFQSDVTDFFAADFADFRRFALREVHPIRWTQSATPVAYLGCFASKGVLR